MPEHEIAFRIDEPVVLLGTAALLLWLCSERLLQLIGPKAKRQEPFWWYSVWYRALLARRASARN